jgi:ABC-type phosphate transport system substrate-binding protein
LGIRAFVLLMGVGFLFFGRSAAQTNVGSDIAVVVHPDTPVSDLSLADIRSCFLGQSQYWRNTRIPVVLLLRAPVARERDVALKVVYQMTENQFRQYWIAQIYRAEVAAGPKDVYSNDQETQLLSSIPGAIGLMEAREARSGVKIVRVDGRLPGEPGYPLR